MLSVPLDSGLDRLTSTPGRTTSWARLVRRRKTAPPFAAQDGVSLGGHSGALRTAHHLRQPLPALGQIGVWDRIFEAVSRAYDGDLQMIDSSSIRVHQHGGNAKKGSPTASAAARDEPRAECMGRSRGGLTTKIAPLDANGLPVVLKLSEGQAHDGRSAADMLGDLRAGQVLIADRAYDSDLLRQAMPARGVWANIKPLARRRARSRRSGFSAITRRRRLMASGLSSHPIDRRSASTSENAQSMSSSLAMIPEALSSVTRQSCLCASVQISQPWYQYRFAPCTCSRHVHDLEPHSKDDTHSTAILNVGHTLADQAWKGISGNVAIETGNSPTR